MFWEYFFCPLDIHLLYMITITHNCYNFGQSQMYAVIVIP